MQSVTLVFPHQLFKKNPAVKNGIPVILVEEYLFFNKYNFHKQKLVLQRASMQFYKDWLVKNGTTVNYIEASDARSEIRTLIKWLSAESCTEIHYVNVTDNWLQKRIADGCAQNKIAATEYDTPSFINTTSTANAFFDKRKTYFQTDFYIHQRKKMNILIDPKGLPVGGQWSYDADNRLKFPKDAVAPDIELPDETDFVKAATLYIEKNYPNNYGNLDSFIYPTDFTSAEKWLENFLESRFEKFGAYEDAIVLEEHFLHHSVLSPLLNIGLLLPQQVVDKAVVYAAQNNIPINSLEGFIRQIIGWREFIYIVYEREGTKQRTSNYWGHTRKIPASFWTGNTGIGPIDNIIKKLIAKAYCHHIERLMLVGNFMLLCEFEPNEVYKWFMELFIDSYDWVMVPNVYGMTQFADGGLMTTKPYISGSNYVLKMSNHKKGNWGDIWDGLFWRFMHIHRNFFSQNPRLRMLLHTFDKMPAALQQKHLDQANNFLKKLDNQK